MWNERYNSPEYMYGTEPNSFLAENAGLLAGPVLSLAEGEGRNAAFLASLGLDVLGVDSSDVGLAKAQQLAEAKGVRIRTEVNDLASYVPPVDHFGSVVSISAHLPSDIRRKLYPLVLKSLKVGGTVLLEAYSKSQLGRNTGGPKNPDELMDADDIQKEFPNCEVLLCQEIEREVIEGVFHTGLAAVVQFIARKKA